MNSLKLKSIAIVVECAKHFNNFDMMSVITDLSTSSI